MSTDFRFNLGDKVKDHITGLAGIVVSRSESLYGCNRYWLQPQEVKDGKPVDGCWLDEDSLELVTANAIKRKRYRVYEDDEQPIRRAGGPGDQPSATTRQTTR